MRTLRFFAAAVIALFIIGCGAGPTATVEKMPEEVRALLDAHGMTDQKIVETADGDRTECIFPPAVDTEYGVYAVTFIWGRLLASRTAPTDGTVWTGCLALSGAEGAVKAIFPIDFEDKEDYLDDAGCPSRVCWVSTTSGDFDGLGVLVRVREASALTDSIPFLHFETNPFSIDLPISKLNNYADYFPVGDAEGVAILARRVGGVECPKGFMKGEWKPASDHGDNGFFSGMWYDLFGVPVGTMAGLFETVDGERRFKGWLSGVYLTVVLAELEGAWSYCGPPACVACGEGRGWFAGSFRYLHGGKSGVMRGVIGGPAPVSESAQEKRALPLKGTWRVNCPRLEDCPFKDDGQAADPCAGAEGT